MSEATPAQGDSALDRAAADGPLSGAEDLDRVESAGQDESPTADAETIADEYGRGVRPGGLVG